MLYTHPCAVLSDCPLTSEEVRYLILDLAIKDVEIPRSISYSPRPHIQVEHSSAFDVILAITAGSSIEVAEIVEDFYVALEYNQEDISSPLDVSNYIFRLWSIIGFNITNGHIRFLERLSYILASVCYDANEFSPSY